MSDQLKKYSSGTNIYPSTTIDKVKLSDTSDTTLKDYLDEAGICTKDLEIKVSNTGWSNNGNMYTKTINVKEVTENDNPIFLLKSSSVTPSELEIKSFDNIKYICTYNGQIVIYSYNIPLVDITIILKGLSLNMMNR